MAFLSLSPGDALDLTLKMYPTFRVSDPWSCLPYPDAVHSSTELGIFFPQQIVYHVRRPEAVFPCSSRGIIHDKTLNLNVSLVGAPDMRN
jgi:hypothetical protein